MRVFLLCAAHGATVMVREAPKTSDPRIEAAVEFARLVGAETGFASMYWPDRLVWTQYVNARQGGRSGLLAQTSGRGGDYGITLPS